MSAPWQLDPIQAWVDHVRQGFSLETVPEEYRAQVEHRLRQSENRAVPRVPGAKPQPASAREPWWRGTWGILVAMLLPFVALALLIWLLARVPQRAGGTGFVEGFGKLKGPGSVASGGFQAG